MARIDNQINDYVSKGWETGVVTILIKDNQIRHHKDYRLAEIEAKKLWLTMSYSIANESNCCVAAMILYEEGKFLLVILSMATFSN